MTTIYGATNKIFINESRLNHEPEYVEIGLDKYCDPENSELTLNFQIDHSSITFPIDSYTLVVEGDTCCILVQTSEEWEKKVLTFVNT